MRILMTADTVGGVWTYALDLARALEPHGVEVELATMGRRLDDDQRAALARSPVAALHESEYRLEWEHEPWEDVDRAGRWLLELEDRLAPDVVHLNGYAHASLPWRAPAVVVAHSDVLSWFDHVKRRPAPARWERYRAAVEAGLRAAAAVCAPTQAVLADLERHYSFRTERFVVHNCSAQLAPTADKQPFVLGLGRFWDEAKNLTALEAVRGALPWPVLLAGAGSPLGRLSDMAVAELLARASVFASPALYEPFGLAVLEAAHAGCALVLGDIASLREVWADAALFVAPDDPDALAAALHRVAADAELCGELAARAARRSRLYTPERTALGYLGVYARVRAGVPA